MHTCAETNLSIIACIRYDGCARKGDRGDRRQLGKDIRVAGWGAGVGCDWGLVSIAIAMVRLLKGRRAGAVARLQEHG